MDMREKMIRAMAQADGVPVALSEMPTAALSRYAVMADAGLSALAEPTEAMVAAGGDELLADWDDPIGATTAIFHAMIAKAKDG